MSASHDHAAPFAGRRAVVTGGTSGIGAATALLLRAGGADVTVIGRSADKAGRLLATAATTAGPGSMRAVTADFSIMRNVEDTVADLAAEKGAIDLLVHGVGTLISHTAHTVEGIELDFAVSYLSRFVFLEAAARHNLLVPRTRMINIAASAPRIPRYARMEFDDLSEVASRVGMRSHGQAQLANELLTAHAPQRYGITAVGYGPGSARTDIRRELSPVLLTIMKPFFHFTTREPIDVAREIVDVLGDPHLQPAVAHFRNRKGGFPADPFIADRDRQQDLIRTSLAFVATALGRQKTR